MYKENKREQNSMYSINGPNNLANNPFASDHFFLTQNQQNFFSFR